MGDDSTFFIGTSLDTLLLPLSTDNLLTNDNLLTILYDKKNQITSSDCSNNIKKAVTANGIFLYL